jgi:hypothetical protein
LTGHRVFAERNELATFCEDVDAADGKFDAAGLNRLGHAIQHDALWPLPDAH